MSEPVYVTEQPWEHEQKVEFLRRRRARNYLLLAALGGLCVMIYTITLVKLLEHGAIW